MLFSRHNRYAMSAVALALFLSTPARSDRQPNAERLPIATPMPVLPSQFPVSSDKENVANASAVDCEAVSEQFHSLNGKDDQASMSQMVDCGFDITARLKADIAVANSSDGFHALEIWNSHVADPVFIKARFAEFIIDNLLNAEPIKNWSTARDRRYYLKVRGLMISGNGPLLHSALSKRADYSDLGAFMRWYQINDDFERSIFVD